ncbi:hypothetical protein Tco_0774148 [Tanacetum coccineum]|uniref:Uncharacterized protein n=1 Tax=Tanacetum coccineum TaxID=301880 RepID=A0ABQ4ZRE1_9ASTR
MIDNANSNEGNAEDADSCTLWRAYFLDHTVGMPVVLHPDGPYRPSAKVPTLPYRTGNASLRRCPVFRQNTNDLDDRLDYGDCLERFHPTGEYAKHVE